MTSGGEGLLLQMFSCSLLTIRVSHADIGILFIYIAFYYFCHVVTWRGMIKTVEIKK